MTLFKLLISLIVCLIANQAHSETIKTDLLEHQNNVRTSFELFSKTNRKKFSYTITKYENEEGDVTSSLETYSPAATIPRSWSLIELNGEIPTKKQVNNYLNNKSKKKDKSKNNQSISISQLVDIDTLHILNEDNEFIKSSFKVGYSRFGEDAKEKLEGILTYDKKNRFVKNLEIINNDNFSPMFSADINKLKLTLNFIKIKNAILPLSTTMRLVGSMAMFIEIDEISTVDYSNYSL
jgi:hypothetical protein